MSFRRAKVATALEAPIAALREAGIRTSLFQGCAYAVDPRDGKPYVFQFQAVRTDRGDVEDLRVHRFLIDGTNMVKLDTMEIAEGGHVQSGDCRITELGNPYLMLGLEDYDKSNTQIGKSLYRVRYQAGKRITKSDKTCDRVYTGDGNVDAVGSEDWTIVLRRGSSTGDVYEWHQERGLLSDSVQASAKKGNRPLPSITRRIAKKQPDDDYQSSLAQGKWNGPGDEARAFRITGAEVVLVSNSDYPNEQLDLTEQATLLLEGGNVEPEGAFTRAGLLYVAVQSGSIAKRRVVYIPVSWQH